MSPSYRIFYDCPATIVTPKGSYADYFFTKNWPKFELEYDGEAQVPFTVDISTAEVSVPDQTYTGEAFEPAVDGVATGVASGTAQIEITAVETANYKSATKMVTVTVEAVDPGETTPTDPGEVEPSGPDDESSSDIPSSDATTSKKANPLVAKSQEENRGLFDLEAASALPLLPLPQSAAACSACD